MATIDLESVVTVRAFKPGDVVILIPERPFSMDVFERISLHLGKISTDTGLKFVLLPEFMRVASREESIQRVPNPQPAVT